MARAVPEMPPVHPAANLFPMLPDDELQALADDIKTNGLQQHIVMFGAQLLDGRNRWRACQLAGVEPKLRDWNGDDPIAYVVSLNLHRRHLNEGQRSMVAARIATMKQGARTDIASIEAKSQDEAAELMNVGRSSVQRAAKVVERGTPELIALADAGAVPISTAADVAELEPDEQREVVAHGEKEILAKAKEIRAKRGEERRQERIEKLVEISRGNAELKTPQRYPLIYCDPPWRYEHAISDDRKIENQYPTMDLEDICALPVGDISTDDCVMFMWVMLAAAPWDVDLGDARSTLAMVSEVANPSPGLLEAAACLEAEIGARQRTQDRARAVLSDGESKDA